MKNRVFLIRNVQLDYYGGGETYQLKMAEMLRGAGFEPWIVTSSVGLLKAAKKLKIRTVRAPYFEQQNYSGWRNVLLPIYYVKIMWLRRWYKRIFREFRPSVVNIQSRDDWIAATSVAKRMGIKVLWTDHMDFRSWVLVNVNVWYKGWIGKWVLRCAYQADEIIMISDYERKWFEKNVDKQKFGNIITIKNGVADNYAKYNEIKPIKHNFCYVGRIVDYKGIGELIKAFDAVRGVWMDAMLNIYGDGDIEKYKEIAGDGVVFHGYTNEPLKAIAENDVFVLPSYREGLSLSLIDAAMMGKKILTTNVDGNPEVVKQNETGLLIPAKDARKLAEAMVQMIDDEKRAEEMAKNARNYYLGNFNIDKIFVEKMLPLYNIEKEKE